MELDWNLQDLSSTFSIADVTLTLVLTFLLSSVICLVYKYTHRNVSYSQSYVQTLVMISMIVSVVMLVVGSNLARAFALIGALSVIRFRNAIKETRDVGFIFIVMGIGMACGTRFYSLAAIATVVICLVIVLMYRFNWFKLDVQRQIVKVQVPAGEDHLNSIQDVLVAQTSEFELISTESIRGGALTEVAYAVRLKKGRTPHGLLATLQERTSGQRVTVLTGYDQSDL